MRLDAHLGRLRGWGIVLAGSLFAFVAAAQTYPPLPDPTRTSTGTPYPNQSPLPTGQQANPYLTPGMPVEAAPGVPNGMATQPVPPLRPPPVPTTPAPDALPPSSPPSGPSSPSAQRLTPMGTMPLYADPDTLTFQPVPELPPGTEVATVKALPDGGRELYLRLPATGEVPPMWLGHPAELTFLRGRITMRGPLPSSAAPSSPRPPSGARSWFVAEPGGHFAMPSRTAYAFRCQGGEPCLVLVHSDGPFEPHRASEQPVPAPPPLP